LTTQPISRRWTASAALALGLAAVALARGRAGAAGGKGATAPPAQAPAPAPVDVTAVRDRLIVLGDGRDHFVALIPFGRGDDRQHVYYGDGRRFYAQRVWGGASSGTEMFAVNFWDPRFVRGVEAELRFKDGRYTVSCGDRDTELKPLPADGARALTTQAAFFKPLWPWRSYALARDDRGTYFYVDRQREPADSRNFRLFSGPRGKLKQLDMINVVSDSVGEIFVTRSGKLWLIFGKEESFWIRGKTRQGLTNVPVQDNAALIHDEVGAYAGQRLGTPCDDL
jgi:hypothetical protein